MSEPKIREFLENFDVQVSRGSVSNILTNTADAFEPEFDDTFRAGLASTPYQQTDDTSARVAGAFWHTHIVCNPFYAAYFTRARQDRLTLLEVLQNTSDLRFRFGRETLELLTGEFTVSDKWRPALSDLGERTFDRESLKHLLDGWFGEGNVPLRTAIEQAAAIVHYRHQTSLSTVQTIVCDDAGQFKLLTNRLALCWIHAGRHYEKLSSAESAAPRLIRSIRGRNLVRPAVIASFTAADGTVAGCGLGRACRGWEPTHSTADVQAGRNPGRRDRSRTRGALALGYWLPRLRRLLPSCRGTKPGAATGRPTEKENMQQPLTWRQRLKPKSWRDRWNESQKVLAL